MEDMFVLNGYDLLSNEIYSKIFELKYICTKMHSIVLKKSLF